MLRIPLSALLVDERRNVSRGGRSLAASSVEALAADLAAHGQLEPVGVVSLALAPWIDRADEHRARGVTHVLVYGYRRALAARAAKLDTILAIDCGAMNEDTAALANLAENWSREPPTEYDLTIAVAGFVARKVGRLTIAHRIHKAPTYVEECSWIVRRVAPELLRHYAIDSRREMRRKMIALANVEGGTERERHEAQIAQWRAWEAAEQAERRRNPDAGTRPPRRGSTDSPATRTELRGALEALAGAEHYHDGSAWQPMTAEVRAALVAALAWAIRPTVEIPWK